MSWSSEVAAIVRAIAARHGVICRARGGHDWVMKPPPPGWPPETPAPYAVWCNDCHQHVTHEAFFRGVQGSPRGDG